MLQREFGRTGITCSAIGLGTWAIGGAMWGGADDAASRRAIDAALDAGVTLIDSAPGYGLGHAETLVGEAIRGRRDRVVLATKCGLNWHHGRGPYFFEQYGRKVHRYLGRDGIEHELEESLRRLGTDHVDIYITHWQDPTTPIADTVETLLRLKQAGKIRAIGASNLAPQELSAYIATGGLDAIQERYSLIDRGIEGTLLPLAAAAGVATMAYSPMAMGLLTGTVTPGRQFEGDDIRRDNPRFSVANRQAVQDFAAAAGGILAAHAVTLGQLVVAWALRRPGIDVVLCGARGPEQALQNARAGAMAVALRPDELAVIDDAAGRHLAALMA